MNSEWLKLAGVLLKQASEQMANAGCNDWMWPDGWGTLERRALVEAMVTANTGRAEADFTANDREEVRAWCAGEYGPPDWWVAAFLARKLQEYGK